MIRKVEHTELVRVSKENYLAEYSPKKCLRFFTEVKTIEQSIDAKSDSLVVLKKQYGENFVIGYIALWIDDLQDFCNLKTKMNKEQMMDTALLLYSDFKHLTVSDIHLIMTNIKRGEYGQLYEKLDGQKLIVLFKKYFDERVKICYERGLNEHDVIKKHGFNRSKWLESKTEEINKMNNKEWIDAKEKKDTEDEIARLKMELERLKEERERIKQSNKLLHIKTADLLMWKYELEE
jgi:hypothetical protein